MDLRSPLIFGYGSNYTLQLTPAEPDFVARRASQQLASTSRCVPHRVPTSAFSFQPGQANALSSRT